MLFPSRRELGIVFAVLATSCVWTFGLAGLLGVKLSFLHLLGFPILLGTGIERRLRGRSPAQAASAALESMGPHMLAGMLTTSVGFCASCVMLLPTSTSFGLLAGAAIAWVYLASLFVLPVPTVRADAAQPITAISPP